MNKHIIWGLLAMIIASCSNDEMTEIVEMKQTGIAVTAGLTSNTRINFEQDGDVVYAHWDSDDQITLYADSQGGLDYQVSSVDDAGTTASFSAVKDVLQNTDEVIYATYPATTITDGVAILPVTSVWSDTRDMSFAYAVGNVADGKVDLQFKHLYAYLKLTLNAETVSGIDTNEISGLWITNSSGDWISTNSGTYDFNSQTCSFTEGTNCMIIEFEETFVADGDAEKVVYIPIIPLGSGNTINLSVLHEHEIGCDTLHIISKDAPESGFEAGKVYTYTPTSPFIKEGNSITLKVAGTLSQAISAEAKDTITSLKISGPLNGDDIRFIREMAGRNASGNETEGKLVDLDMSGASIVEGGGLYYFVYYTENNIITSQMFQSTILERIILPKGTLSIGDYAFDGCSSLSSIIIPDGVTLIGDCAFRRCSSLASVVLPKGVISIGEVQTFSECSSLTSIVIPDGVSLIGERAFYQCTSLTEIIIPDGVESIGSQCFCFCSSLQNVLLPEMLSSINSEVFQDCIALNNISIPDNVTLIDRQAFAGCETLATITIGNSVTSIGDAAFDYCLALQTLEIPNSVTSIGKGAFGYCLSLVDISLGDGLEAIGDGAFDYCPAIPSLIFPDGVTSIGNHAFLGCESLSEIVIGSSMSSIGEDAFFNCVSLNNVTCKATTPPTLGVNAFYNISPTAELLVHSGYMDVYANSEWFAYFAGIGEQDLW